MTKPVATLAAVVSLYRHKGPLPSQQRLASGVAGVSLAFSGLRRGGFLGVVMAVAGADLIYRGIRGEGHIHELLHAPSPKLLPQAVAKHSAA